MDLDNLEALRANDPGGLGARIAELPRQCIQGWEIAQGGDLPSEYMEVGAVAILGMGGSAIGGDLVKAIAADRCRVPIQVIRDYRLPGSVGPDTLVIASSHSGETEETLTAFEEARLREARLAAVTTGGRLAEIARKHDIPLLEFAHPGPPRAAIGFSLSLLLGILWKARLIPDPSKELDTAIAGLKEDGAAWTEDVPLEANAAKRIARRLTGRIPVVYGAEHLAPVARRWKTQFNEVAKTAAFFETLPELNHNSIEGTSFPSGLTEEVSIVMLVSKDYHNRTSARVGFTRQILRDRGIRVVAVKAPGRGRLDQALRAVHLGDYASLYLAALNGVDPDVTEKLDSLKQRMADSKGAG